MHKAQNNQMVKWNSVHDSLRSGYLSTDYANKNKHGLPRTTVLEVLDVLNLYEALHRFQLENKGSPLSTMPFSSFPGFNGEKEGEHLGFALHLIKETPRYSSLQTYLQVSSGASHQPLMKVYRRMIDTWQRTGALTVISESQVKQILGAALTS